MLRERRGRRESWKGWRKTLKNEWKLENFKKPILKLAKLRNNYSEEGWKMVSPAFSVRYLLGGNWLVLNSMLSRGFCVIKAEENCLLGTGRHKYSECWPTPLSITQNSLLITLQKPRFTIRDPCTLAPNQTGISSKNHPPIHLSAPLTFAVFFLLFLFSHRLFRLSNER